MAIYTEVGSGGLETYGCAVLEYIKYHFLAFDVGDIAYSSPKARKGKIEKIAIKRIDQIDADLIWGQSLFIYVDTFNALWNETDLVDYDEAIALIDAYSRRMQREAKNVKSCN